MYQCLSNVCTMSVQRLSNVPPKISHFLISDKNIHLISAKCPQCLPKCLPTVIRSQTSDLFPYDDYQMRFSFPGSLCNHHWNLQKRLSTVCQFTQGHYAIRHVDKHLRVDNMASNGQFKTFPRLDWAEKSNFLFDIYYLLLICN